MLKSNGKHKLNTEQLLKIEENFVTDLVYRLLFTRQVKMGKKPNKMLTSKIKK